MAKRPVASKTDGVAATDGAQPEPAELAAAMAAKRYGTRPLRSLVPYARNSRTHTRAQISMLKGMLMEFGWTRPVAMAEDVILAGHGITMAALELANDGKCPPGWPDPWSAPVVDLSHLSAAQRRAYVIADNRAAEVSGWDKELLAMELGELQEDGFKLDLTGWDDAELRKLLGDDPTGEGDGGGDDVRDENKHILMVEFASEQDLAAAFEEAKERGWSCKIMS